MVQKNLAVTFLLQSALSWFRLKTNNTVVWLYVGGVSLILSDLRFGMVSQDWVINCHLCGKGENKGKLWKNNNESIGAVVVGEKAHVEMKWRKW